MRPVTKLPVVFGFTLALAMFLVAALNGGGISHAQNPSPTGLSLTSGPMTISATWNAVSGADYYQVEWYRMLAGNKADHISRNISKTSHTMTVSLTGEWTVDVSSCDNTGACGSAASAQVDVTRTGAPEPTERPVAPTGFTLTDQGSFSVSASWDESADATYYRLRWRLPGQGFARGDKARLTDNEANFSVSHGATWVVRLDACNSKGCRHSTKRVTVVGPQFDETIPTPENFTAKPDKPGSDEYVFSFIIPKHPDSSVTLEGAHLCIEGTSADWRALYKAQCENYVFTRDDHKDIRTLSTIRKTFDKAPLVPNMEYKASVSLISSDGDWGQSATTSFTVDTTGTALATSSPELVSVSLVGNTGAKVSWENMAALGANAMGAQVCLDMAKPDAEWLGAVCELVTDSSSKTYTFGEWPLLFNRAYIASAQLFTTNGFISDPVAKTFTVPGASLTTPMTPAPPTNLRTELAKSSIGDLILSVRWDSTYDENGKALEPTGWRMCMGESCKEMRPDDRWQSYTNPTPGTTITLQSLAKYNGVLLVSKPVSGAVPIVAPATNLRITYEEDDGDDLMRIQWDSSYVENGKAMEPEGWRVCLGESCFNRDPGSRVITRGNPTPGMTITVRGMATAGIEIYSESVSGVAPYVAPPKNLQFRWVNIVGVSHVVVSWASSYSSDSMGALKPTGWEVCMGNQCGSLGATSQSALYADPTPGTTVKVRGKATSGIELHSNWVSGVVPNR